MRKLFVLFVIFSVATKSGAIEFKSSAWQFNTIYGEIVAHDQKVKDLHSSGIWGAEINYLLPSKAFKNKHLSLYNYPEIGLGLVYLDLGNPETTGQLLALYPFLNWNVLRIQRFSLNFKPGVGISFLSKTYDNTNQSNKVIGSKLNVYFALGTNLEYRVWNRMSINWDFHANHASNGNFEAPNIGYNMVNTSLGLKFYTNYTDYHKTNYKADAKPKNKYHLEIIASGGRKELYYREAKVYPTGSLVVSAVRNFSSVFQMGFATDLFYNESYSAVNSSTIPSENTSSYQRTYLTEDKLSNRFRVGISIQPEIIFNRLSAGIHLGVYLFNPIKNLEPYAAAGNLNKGLLYPYDVYNEDGWLYSRAALKFRLTDNLFISMGLKTHLNKSEFIEWGFGYKIY